VFTAIFLALLIGGWVICAYLPWAVWSIATKGQAGVQYLPLCVFAGVVCALAVPVLGADGMTGFWVSFPVAGLASLGALVAAHAGRTGRSQLPRDAGGREGGAA
jgi:hypothetical protein